VLTPFDDYPVHQTPLPIAHAGGGHPDFYDRFWFNGYTEDYYFAVALAIYPNRGIIDAAFAVVHDGWQRSLFASGRMPLDPTQTRVGPIGIDITEPLRVNRVRVDSADLGITADLEFRARTAAFSEPRQTLLDGTKPVMDVTRLAAAGLAHPWPCRRVRDQGQILGHPAGRAARAGRTSPHDPADLLPLGAAELRQRMPALHDVRARRRDSLGQDRRGAARDRPG